MQQPEHKPAGGTPEWAARPERSNIQAMRLIVWIALTLGRPVARAFLVPISAYFLLFSARATRAASRKYLARALGRKPRLLDVYRHCHTFSSVILDRVFLLSDRFEMLDIRLHNLEAVQAAMAGGHGSFCSAPTSAALKSYARWAGNNWRRRQIW
jgi:predicted LPLAT superfamily acyltransferase